MTLRKGVLEVILREKGVGGDSLHLLSMIVEMVQCDFMHCLM